MSGEPILQHGDSGEWVTHLQELMRDAEFWQGDANGTFDDDLEQAVQTMQGSLGLPQTGVVDADTWTALEQQVPSSQQPADQQAADQQSADQQPGQDDASGDAGQAPYLSDDGQWQWDGTQWQPATQDTATQQPETQTSDDVQMQLSDDGQWQWDGTQWQPTAANSQAVGLQLDGDVSQPSAGGSQLPTGGLNPQTQSGISSASTDSALTGFATGSAVLTAEHQNILNGIAADLNANPLTFGGYVTLTGYADRRGDPAANQQLGQQRADAVRDYLLQLLTDDETRQQIRAYSLGAPSDGPVGDQPDLRKVEIVITRRTYNVDLGPGLTMPGSSTPTQPMPDGRPPIDLNLHPHYRPPDPNHPDLPDWFWRELPQRPADPSFITQLSRWANQALHTHDIARIGGEIASHFGMDRGRVTHMLDEAFQNGGEEAVKAILNSIIERAAGSPAQPPNSPTGPAVNELPTPPILQTPPIPLPPPFN